MTHSCVFGLKTCERSRTAPWRRLSPRGGLVAICIHLPSFLRIRSLRFARQAARLTNRAAHRVSALVLHPDGEALPVFRVDALSSLPVGDPCDEDQPISGSWTFRNGHKPSLIRERLGLTQAGHMLILCVVLGLSSYRDSLLRRSLWLVWEPRGMGDKPMPTRLLSFMSSRYRGRQFHVALAAFLIF